MSASPGDGQQYSRTDLKRVVAGMLCFSLVAMIPVPLLVIYVLERHLDRVQYFDLMLGPLWLLFALPGIGATIAVAITLYDAVKFQPHNRTFHVVVILLLQVAAVLLYWIVELRRLLRREPNDLIARGFESTTNGK